MVARTDGNIWCKEQSIRNQSSTKKVSKLFHKRALLAYSGVFLLAVSFLTLSNQGSNNIAVQSDTVSASQAVATSSNTSSQDAGKISVDQLTAANVVTNLAETTNLPASGNLREATTTLTVKKELAQNDSGVITKPQIIQPETSAGRGLKNYVTKSGDTIESIAKQFKVSAQTIRWANNMTSDAVEPGKTLVIPMVDGVVYTIKDGDTIEKIAEKYKVNAERVTLYNDLTNGVALAKDTRIVLPGAELPENERPGYTAPRGGRSRSGNGSPSAQSGSGSTYGNPYYNASVGNRYAPGNCTWYVYERRAELGRPIGSFWGNATSWANSARSAGFLVDNNPTPGAIFQTTWGGYGLGHVGMVERVDAQNIYISDMNYAGYNIVTHRVIPMSEVHRYNFIH